MALPTVNELAEAIVTAWQAAPNNGLTRTDPYPTQEQIMLAQATGIATAVLAAFASAIVTTTDTGTATGAMGGGAGVPVVATGTGTIS